MGSLPIEEPVLKDGKLEQFTLKISGEQFYCKCKCNVFHKPDRTNEDLYKCNCCDLEYEAT